MSNLYINITHTHISINFSCCGPSAAIYPYILESHSKKFRNLLMVIMGIFVSIALLILPVLAYNVIPTEWSYTSKYFKSKHICLHYVYKYLN